MVITNHDRIGKASPKRAVEALAYTSLIQSRPEITRLARETPQAAPVQTDLM